MATGGKPYYLAGLLPALIGAGSISVDGWLEHARTRVRRAMLVAAVAASAVIGVIIALPVLRAESTGPVLALNEDVGETIGGPQFSKTVAGVYRRLPRASRAVILTGNYGEAGAIDRYGPDLGLPRAYSGTTPTATGDHRPTGAAPVIAIGLRPGLLEAYLRDCSPAARIDNQAGVDNEEQGAAVMVCTGPRRPWSRQWPQLRRLG